MSWQDRIKEAAYTSPSGVRIGFIYEDVALGIDKKTTAFNFPDVDGTFVQDLGRTGRRLPLRLIISGDDYDLQAQQLLDALTERGTGRLEHPAYGVIDVVPFGRISRRDDLKTAGNQAVFDVQFFETIGLSFPTSQMDPSDQVETAIDEYNETSAEQFKEKAQLDTTVKKTAFQNVYERALGVTRSTLQSVADATESTRRRFDAIGDSITASVTDLVGDPQTLIAQTNQFIEVAGESQAKIEDKIDKYRAIVNDVIAQARASNFTNFLGAEVFAVTSTVGQIVSSVNNTFETKTDALSAAEEILDTFDAVAVWRDDNYQFFEEIDTGEAYQKYQEAVAIAAGFLVEISFDLKQERMITLDRARTIIDLAAELYGEVDAQLDFLITSNNLTGDEIIELPVGREMVYYI